MNARRSFSNRCCGESRPTDGVRGRRSDATTPGITVSGLVQDRVAEPISGATVLVGKSSVTSRSDGTFSIPGVMVPYDITAILPAQNTAVVYKGLTRSDPVLLYPDVAAAERTATISGTVPPAAGSVTVALRQQRPLRLRRRPWPMRRRFSTPSRSGGHGSYDTDPGQLSLLRFGGRLMLRDCRRAMTAMRVDQSRSVRRELLQQ